MPTPTEMNEAGNPNPLAELRLRQPPFALVAFIIVSTVATLVPITAIARARFSTSEAPPIRIFQDMGSQPRATAQQSSEVFADGRAARPKIEGTVSTAAIIGNDPFTLGYTMGADGKPVFIPGFPANIKVDEKLLDRGHDRFNIYCSACHGVNGSGNGYVNVRASQVANTVTAYGTSWVQPANLHDETRRARPAGHIFNTITNGIRNMGGLGQQIQDPADRWAIVAYVRALQLSDTYPATQLPSEIRENMK